MLLEGNNKKFDLTGKVALITGGNGLAFAKELVKCGAKVVIWGIKHKRLFASNRKSRLGQGDGYQYQRCGEYL
jgi:NAD(P)-dependent dehydrogenase (short-subunit alcohol dehydrogenase family)